MKPYTVTMTATYFVNAESADEARGIVSEAILRIDQVEKKIIDSETDWFHAVILDGHFSTIVRDHNFHNMGEHDGMSDYEIEIARLKSVQNKCDCGANITENDNDGEMCTACYAEYWSKWCEECGADPDEPCATDCPNINKPY